MLCGVFCPQTAKAQCDRDNTYSDQIVDYNNAAHPQAVTMEKQLRDLQSCQNFCCNNDNVCDTYSFEHAPSYWCRLTKCNLPNVQCQLAFRANTTTGVLRPPVETTTTTPFTTPATPPPPCPIISVPPWSLAQRVQLARNLDRRCYLDPEMPRIPMEIDGRCVPTLGVASNVPDVVRCWQLCCEHAHDGCTTMSYYIDGTYMLFSCPTHESCPMINNTNAMTTHLRDPGRSQEDLDSQSDKWRLMFSELGQKVGASWIPANVEQGGPQPRPAFCALQEGDLIKNVQISITRAQVVQQVIVADLVECMKMCCETERCTAVQYEGGRNYVCQLLDCRTKDACKVTTAPEVPIDGNTTTGNGTFFRPVTMWVAMLRVPHNSDQMDVRRALFNQLGDGRDAAGNLLTDGAWQEINGNFVLFPSADNVNGRPRLVWVNDDLPALPLISTSAPLTAMTTTSWTQASPPPVRPSTPATRETGDGAPQVNRTNDYIAIVPNISGVNVIRRTLFADGISNKKRKTRRGV